MLSFFKKKSPENEVPMDSQNHNQSIEFAEDALLRELGYKDTEDLRETIYGELLCYLICF